MLGVMENRGAWGTYVGLGVMFVWPILIVIASLTGTSGLVLAAWGMFEPVLLVGGFIVGVYLIFIRKDARPKPDGYVGFFRRPDGLEVHVSRVNGQLMVISEEKPGVFPRNLGNVTGRDLVGWTKLRATPDN